MKKLLILFLFPITCLVQQPVDFGIVEFLAVGEFVASCPLWPRKNLLSQEVCWGSDTCQDGRQSLEATSSVSSIL